MILDKSLHLPNACIKCLLDFAIVNSFTFHTTQKSTAALYKRKHHMCKNRLFLTRSYMYYQQTRHTFYKEVSAYMEIRKL